jgi:multimeric flavodoxin WrbA
MQPLYESLLRSDAIIVATPVYFGMPSALCKAFLERVEGFGIREKKLRLKVGGALASGGSRNGGQETAMLAINLWFHINDMLPVGITAPVAGWGAAGNSGHSPGGIAEDRFRLTNTGNETSSLEVAWMYGRKIATVAMMVKAGRAALDGLDLPDGPYGWTMPSFPSELNALLTAESSDM